MKKSERFSFKKLTPSHKRQDSKVVQQSVIFNKNKSYKPKSTEKPNQPPEYKFKVAKYGQYDKSHLKTQMNQTHNKTPYQKYPAFRKKEKVRVERNRNNLTFNQTKKHEKIQSQKSAEGKNKTLKKLQLNQELFRIIRNSSAEKHHHYDGLISGKNHSSFRKPHESHRSVYKKTALEDYVSNSLQNLKPNKKPLPKPPESKKEEKLFTKKGNQTVLRDKKQKLKNLLVCEDITEELKHKDESTVQRQSRLQKNEERSKKIRTEKDESLENFKIKFQKSNKYDLSKQQIDIFGDRFPDGFQKLKLLGRGGFSLVWLGEHKKSKKKYAVKQIITQSSHQTHIKQIWFGTYFFQFGGAPKEQFAHHPGINNLVKLYYYFINKKDTWILYEKCGDSLGNALYDLKGEKVNNQKIYRIHYKSLYTRIKSNQDQLRKIILQVAKALQLLAQNNIVHSDLKTENILVRDKTQEQFLEPNDDGTSIAETKLIDYGSSFVFNNLRQFSMATPQYMAPEILNFILYQNQLQYIHKLLEYVQKYNKAWVIDIWSLGCVILQIISGIPLWMSLKTIVKKGSEQFIKYGLFAVKGRLFDKIIRKQIEVIQNLDHFLYEQNYSGIVLEDDLRALLKKMLALNPQKRISPSEIIQFLTEDVSSSELKQQSTLKK